MKTDFGPLYYRSFFDTCLQAEVYATFNIFLLFIYIKFTNINLIFNIIKVYFIQKFN